MKDKRVRINKVMAGWSNGERVNLAPSVRREVSDYGKMMREYHQRIEQGLETECWDYAVLRGEARCYEYEASLLWEQGLHIQAFNTVAYAATMLFSKDEDRQWLNPEETPHWHPQLKAFVRLVRRCQQMCQADPRLWALYHGSDVEQMYTTFQSNIYNFYHTT